MYHKHGTGAISILIGVLLSLVLGVEYLYAIYRLIGG